MALFYECTLKCARKLLDTADIVRDAIFQQLSAGGKVVKTNFVSVDYALYFGATLENTLGS